MEPTCDYVALGNNLNAREQFIDLKGHIPY